MREPRMLLALRRLDNSEEAIAGAHEDRFRIEAVRQVRSVGLINDAGRTADRQDHPSRGLGPSDE